MPRHVDATTFEVFGVKVLLRPFKSPTPDFLDAFGGSESCAGTGDLRPMMFSTSIMPTRPRRVRTLL